MKLLMVVSLIVLNSIVAVAEETSNETLMNIIEPQNPMNQTSDVTEIIEPEAETNVRDSAMEAGLLVHSINSGSEFFSFGLTEEINEKFSFGAKLMMPLSYSKEVQVYMGQLIMRYSLLNTENYIYAEPSFTQGFFDDVSASRPFIIYGLNLGYMRKIDDTIRIGLNAGVDYGTKVAHEHIYTNSHIVYSKIALITSYTF